MKWIVTEHVIMDDGSRDVESKDFESDGISTMYGVLTLLNYRGAKKVIVHAWGPGAWFSVCPEEGVSG